MRAGTVVVLVILGLGLLGGIAFSLWGGPRLREVQAGLASEAGRIRGTVRVAGDNYLGYWYLSSPQFLARLREGGYAIRWTDDGGNYAERHEKFARGDHDIMVLPVNSYLEHGQRSNYPGVIPVAISESKGADSILAYKEKVVGLDERPAAVNDLNNRNLRICFTPDSPSSFLLNIAIAHFALDELKGRGAWSVDTSGSRDAYAKLASRQCDAAVLWEPDVSRALQVPGVVPVFGSDQVSEMIVDVFVVKRQLLVEDPERVRAFFQAYFDTMGYYEAHPDERVDAMVKGADFPSREAVERAAARIAWFPLHAQCREWFGVDLPGVTPVARREKIVDVLSSVTKVMVNVGALQADPLQNNPYRIVNRDALGGLCAEQGTPGGVPGSGAISRVFAPLSEEEWGQLRVVGKLRVSPITFAPATVTLTRDGAQVIDQVAALLVHNYPQYRVVIRGHTAPSSNEEANMALAQERAEAVRSYLERNAAIEANRLLTVSVGSREALLRQPGEGELSYRNRLARVEFLLTEDRA